MPQRPDQKKPSSLTVRMRVTPEEQAEMMNTARYLKETVSEMLRRLARQERHRLGLRPMRRG